MRGTHVGLSRVKLFAEREEARIILLLCPLSVAVRRLVNTSPRARAQRGDLLQHKVPEPILGQWEGRVADEARAERLFASGVEPAEDVRLVSYVVVRIEFMNGRDLVARQAGRCVLARGASEGFRTEAEEGEALPSL